MPTRGLACDVSPYCKRSKFIENIGDLRLAWN
jgi:hypothetical protein